MPNFIIKAFDKDYNEVPFAIYDGDFTMKIPDDCVLKRVAQQDNKVDLQTTTNSKSMPCQHTTIVKNNPVNGAKCCLNCGEQV